MGDEREGAQHSKARAEPQNFYGSLAVDFEADGAPPENRRFPGLGRV